MKKILCGTLLTMAIMTQPQSQIFAANPLLEPFNTPHGAVPFDKISNKDYEPAVKEGIRIGLQQVEAICNNRATPDFENTIVALENSGKELSRVLNVFYPLSSAMTDDEMMEISMRITPLLSDYSTAISLNERLWNKVKYVWDHKSLYNLTPEDSMLLKTTYDSFVRNGALLQGEDREKFRRLSAELSELSTKFSQNVLKELNTYEIWLKSDDLAGLPESVVEAAAFAAKEKGCDVHRT